jgi:hypothetical protein
MNPEMTELLRRVEKVMKERDAFKMALERIKMRESNSHIIAAKVLDEFKEVL